MKIHRSPRFSMRLFFTAFIAIVLLATVIIADILVNGLHYFFARTYRLPDIVWVIIICAVLGSAITELLNRYFLKPILNLTEAMRRVSQGDYRVRLDTGKGFHDILQINEDFNVMVQELNSTEILKTEFVSNVSHEFKTPINAIEGYATLLQGTELSDEEEQGQYISKILFNTTRLSKLVGNILLLSKVDNQGIQTNVTTYRLDEQIRQAIVLMEPRWMKKENEFDVDLESIEYTGNENLLTHVWENLLENAIKYGPQQGLIRMKLTQNNNVITFTIDDEGPGISAEAKKHIFDRFYQADASRRSEGNGLGLALVDRILKLMNGTISVENLPEKGCRFTVQLFLTA